MGESDRYQEYKTEKQRFTLGQPGNALVWLFVLNTVFFLVLLLIQTGVAADTHSKTLFYSRVLNWFQLPVDLNALAQRPWTPVTYMFSDIGLLRIISNMLWLWAFGNVLQSFTGNRNLIPVYIYGGLFGAAFFVLVSNLSGRNAGVEDTSWLMGATPAVMAVAAAATILSPGYRFFSHIGGGIPLWAVMIVFAAIDLGSLAGFPAAYPLSHIGGALAGVLFMLLLRRKTDAGAWMIRMYETISNLFNPAGREKKNNMREKVFYNTGNRKPYNKTSNITQQRVDEILDKINQRGYDSLTKDEKEILRRASEE